MITINDFHCWLGETLMYCQRIENDIKWIYAGMLEGDCSENYIAVSEKSLGEVLKKLEKLDNSDGKPHLSAGDYDLLDEIRDIRNHWAHKAYINFVYKSNPKERENCFLKEYRRLQNDHNRLKKLSDSIEEVRLDVLRKYNKI